jgi:ribosomal-protein-alanine N-acetyltransferase
VIGQARKTTPDISKNKGPLLTASNTKGKPPPKIRTYSKEDINQILEIEQQAFPKTAYPKAAFLSYAKRFPDHFVVIEYGEDILGYMIFDTDGHIHSMAVKPMHRRQGLGTMLFMHAARCAKKSLWLEVRSENKGAIAFYKRMGMEIAGRIQGYYGDDDALIMVFDESKNIAASRHRRP